MKCFHLPHMLLHVMSIALNRSPLQARSIGINSGEELCEPKESKAAVIIDNAFCNCDYR